MNEINSDFLKSLPIVAGCLGNKLGVTVEIGSQACTDGRTITIPAVIDEKAVTREETLGFIVHEASHIRYTDISQADASVMPLQFFIANSIEDARIEKLITGVYIGAEYLLEKKNAPLLKLLEPKICRMPPQNVYPLYAELAPMATYRPSLARLRDKARRRCVKLFGEDLMKKADAVLDEFPNFQCTEDVREAAAKLYGLLDQELKDKDKKNSDSQSSSSQSVSMSAADASGEGNGENGEEKKEDSSESGSSSKKTSRRGKKKAEKNGASSSGEKEAGKEEQSAEKADGSESGSSDSSGNSADGSEDKASPKGKSSQKSGSDSQSNEEGDADAQNLASLKANLRKALDAQRGDITLPDAQSEIMRKMNASKQPGEFPGRIGFGCAAKVCEPAKACSENFFLGVSERRARQADKNGAELMQKAKAESIRTRKALTGIIQAKSRTGIYSADSGKRIQLSKIARLTTGSARVFERREEAVSPDTAVSILFDVSGSVENENREREIIAALALHFALISIPKVKAELSFFPGEGGGFFDEPAVRLVSFGERPEKARKMIGLLQSNGGTPLKEALIQTAVTLSKRREKRRIVFVITDGCVDSGATYVLERLRASGVETVGILVGGIDQNGFSQLFPVSAVLDDFASLQPCLLEIAKRLLLKGIR